MEEKIEYSTCSYHAVIYECNLCRQAVEGFALQIQVNINDKIYEPGIWNLCAGCFAKALGLPVKEKSLPTDEVKP